MRKALSDSIDIAVDNQIAAGAQQEDSKALCDLVSKCLQWLQAKEIPELDVIGQFFSKASRTDVIVQKIMKASGYSAKHHFAKFDVSAAIRRTVLLKNHLFDVAKKAMRRRVGKQLGNYS